MSLRLQGLTVLAALLLAAIPAATLGQEDEVTAGASSPPEPASVDPVAHIVCVDDICRVTDEPRVEEPSAVDTADLAAASEEVTAGPRVCPEGKGACTVIDASASIEDLLATADGRLVYGAVDSDPSGTWRTTNLPTRVALHLRGCWHLEPEAQAHQGAGHDRASSRMALSSARVVAPTNRRS